MGTKGCRYRWLLSRLPSRGIQYPRKFMALKSHRRREAHHPGLHLDHRPRRPRRSYPCQGPQSQFQKLFCGSGSGGGYGATTAIYDIIFSYAGYTNAFNVVNEVKKPVQSLKKSATLALLLVAILYILANVAYFAAVPKAMLAKGKQTVASLFFEAVFGSNVKGLNILIAISAFGNIIGRFDRPVSLDSRMWTVFSSGRKQASLS